MPHGAAVVRRKILRPSGRVSTSIFPWLFTSTVRKPVNDLPRKRDWLDPQIEKTLRSLVS